MLTKPYRISKVPLMTEYVDTILEILQPIWYKGCRIEPCCGGYVVFGEWVSSMLEAELKIINSFIALQGSLVEKDEN